MTSDNFKEWQKKRANDRLAVKEKVIEDLKIKITEIFRTKIDGNFELMVDEIQQLMTKTNVKLKNNEIVDICNIFFHMEKSKDRIKQSHRLDLADTMYQELDHTNSGLLDDNNTVGLFYHD